LRTGPVVLDRFHVEHPRDLDDLDAAHNLVVEQKQQHLTVGGWLDLVDVESYSRARAKDDEVLASAVSNEWATHERDSMLNLLKFPLRLFARLALAVRREMKDLESTSPAAIAKQRVLLDTGLAIARDRRDQATT